MPDAGVGVERVAASPHIAIISPVLPGTGNLSTCRRIERALCSAPDVSSVRVYSSGNLESAAQLRAAVAAGQVECMIGLHALKSGRLMLKHCSEVPFGIILGGTDVNEFASYGRAAQRTIRDCLSAAHAVVAFSEPLVDAARVICPELSGAMVIPQSVASRAALLAEASIGSDDPGPRTQDGAGLARKRQRVSPPEDHVFLLPAGIRPVKDPLYLIPAFSAWAGSDSAVRLEIVGPPLDVKLTCRLKKQCGRGVRYTGLVPRPALLRRMSRAAAVVNTSRSEGMSSALLEAMALGECPVVARDIPGNAALVTHGKTGYLFSSTDEFLRVAKRIVEQRRAQSRSQPKPDPVVAAARARVEEAHTLEAEAKAYIGVVRRLLRPRRDAKSKGSPKVVANLAKNAECMTKEDERLGRARIGGGGAGKSYKAGSNK